MTTNINIESVMDIMDMIKDMPTYGDLQKFIKKCEKGIITMIIEFIFWLVVVIVVCERFCSSYSEGPGNTVADSISDGMFNILETVLGAFMILFVLAPTLLILTLII